MRGICLKIYVLVEERHDEHENTMRDGRFVYICELYSVGSELWLLKNDVFNSPVKTARLFL